MEWHALKAREVMRVLETGPEVERGEAERRLAVYGLNELRREKEKPPAVLFFEQFKSFLIMILLIANVLSIVIGEMLDAII